MWLTDFFIVYISSDSIFFYIIRSHWIQFFFISGEHPYQKLEGMPHPKSCTMRGCCYYEITWYTMSQNSNLLISYWTLKKHYNYIYSETPQYRGNQLVWLSFGPYSGVGPCLGGGALLNCFTVSYLAKLGSWEYLYKTQVIEFRMQMDLSLQ